MMVWLGRIVVVCVWMIVPLVTLVRLALVGGSSEEGTPPQQWIAVFFLMAMVMNQMPRWMSHGLVCLAITAFSWVTRAHSQVGKPPTFAKNHPDDKDQTLLLRRRKQQQQQQPSLTLSRDETAKPKTASMSSLSSKQQQQQQQQEQRKESLLSWHSLSEAGRTLLSCLALIGTLLVDNFMVWIVSWSFPESHPPGPYPPPLQDNGRIVLTYLAETLLEFTPSQLQTVRNVLCIPWALVAGFLATLVHCQLQSPSSQQVRLYRLVRRTVGTLLLARWIRIISYSLTVLPNSHDATCYLRQRYPRVIPEMGSWAWWQQGFVAATAGGCNDLIVSGHATVTATLACNFLKVGNSPPLTWAVVALVALDYALEAYQGYHYSVDMFLGGVVTWLAFSWWERQSTNAGALAEPTLPSRPTEPAEGSSFTSLLPLSSPLSSSWPVIAAHVFPSLLSFWIMVVEHRRDAKKVVVNGSILSFVIVALFLFALRKSPDRIHYARHWLLCTLYIAVSAYL